MTVSPIDLRKQRFGKSFRGFDPVEVTALLTAAAEDYEAALREADRLRQDLGRMEAVLAEHRENERTLRNTLMNAQRLADGIKASAEEERKQLLADGESRLLAAQRVADSVKAAAEVERKRIVADAESRAAFILDKAYGRLEDIQRDIDGLRAKRRDVEASVESTVRMLQNALTFVREQDQRERDDKILLHRPRPVEGPAPEAEQPGEARRALGGLP